MAIEQQQESTIPDDSAANLAYGKYLAECVGVRDAQVPFHRSTKRGTLAVSELKSFIRSSQPNAPVGYDDAFLLAVQLNSFSREFWRDGRSINCEPVLAGMTYIYDLRQDTQILVHDPGHAVTFYMPRATLNLCAEQHSLAGISEMIRADTSGCDDRIMHHLAQAVRAAFAQPHRASSLLLDEILGAACAHALGQFGSARGSSERDDHGLAPWQERRAKELIECSLDASLAELAEACGLSISQFGRAFRRSTGMPPHRWQLARRIARAQDRLTNSTLQIAEISLDCGFSNQSHLTRAFKEATGMTPSHWRRLYGRGNLPAV